MNSIGDLPLNDASQLSNVYSIIENVRCFHHIDLRAAIVMRSGWEKRRPPFSVDFENITTYRCD